MSPLGCWQEGKESSFKQHGRPYALSLLQVLYREVAKSLQGAVIMFEEGDPL
jgi:hypothetical protein